MKKIFYSHLIIILAVIGITINLSNINQGNIQFDFNYKFLCFYISLSYILLLIFLTITIIQTNEKLVYKDIIFEYSLSFLPLFITFMTFIKFFFSPRSSNPPQLFSLTIAISLFLTYQLYLWTKLLKNYFYGIYCFINNNINIFLVIFLFSYYLLNFMGSYTSFLKTPLLNADTFVHINAIFNTANGDIGTSRLLGHIDNFLLSQHIYFIIFLFSFIYKIYSNPIIIFVVIQLFIISSGFLLYKIAKYYLKNNIAAFFISLSFLLNFCIQNIGYVSFRVYFISPFFIILMFYAYTFKNKILFILSFCFLIISKESSLIFLIFFGLSLFFHSKNKRYIVLSITSILLLVLWIFIIQPAMSREYAPLRMHYNIQDTNSFFTLFTNNIKKILTLKKIGYIILLYIPSGFLSFFSPSIIFSSFSDIIYTITAQKQYMLSIYWGYQLNLSTSIYLASIIGIFNINKYFSNISNKKNIIIFLSIYLFFSSFFSNILFYRIINRSFLLTPFKSFRHALELKKKVSKETNILLDKIPEESLLGVSNNLFINNRLLHRKNALIFFPPYYCSPDYLLLNKEINKNHCYRFPFIENGLIELDLFIKNKYDKLSETENYVMYLKKESIK